MTKLKSMRATAAIVSSCLVVSLGVVGVANANQNHGGHHDGPREQGSSQVVENDNDVDVTNSNTQNATTGEANVGGGAPEVMAFGRGGDHHDKHHHNDESDDPQVLGDATTGDARNTNTTDISVDISNDSCGCEEAIDGGHGSSSVKVDNDTDVDIVNNNNQTATSGDATVSGNGNGGSATTGNASNANSTTISVSVAN